MLPDTRVSERVVPPRDLTRTFMIRAATAPVPGEANTTNNRTAWRVTLRDA